MNWLEQKIAEKAMQNWLKAHWGTIASVAGGLIVFLTPSLTAYAAKDPHATISVAILALLKVAQEEKLFSKGQ